jgi:hypothetical protein
MLLFLFNSYITNRICEIYKIFIQMITSDLANPLNENILKSKSGNKSSESMTETGLGSTGAKPRSSHSSQ